MTFTTKKSRVSVRDCCNLPPQPQSQLLQLQHQQQQWLAGASAGVVPATQAPRPQIGVAGQSPAASAPNRGQGGSPTGWQRDGGLANGSTNGGGMNRPNPNTAPAVTATTAAGVSGKPPGSHGEQAHGTSHAPQGGHLNLNQPKFSSAHGLEHGGGRGPAEGGRLRGPEEEGNANAGHSSPSVTSHSKRPPSSKKSDSQALYVPKRSARGHGGESSAPALPPVTAAVPAAGS